MTTGPFTGNPGGLTPQQELDIAHTKIRRVAVVRSVLLAIAAFEAILIGASYVTGVPDGVDSPGLRLIDSAGTLTFWSILWLATGAWATVAALAGFRARYAIVLLASLAGFWALCFAGSQILYGGRGFTTASQFIVIDVFVLGLLVLPHRRAVR